MVKVLFPLMLTVPTAAEQEFEQIDQFLRLTLGEAATARYRIIIDDPTEVAREMARGIEQVRKYRIEQKDSFFFNWSLEVPQTFQQPFVPSPAAMAALALHSGQPPPRLPAARTRAFPAMLPATGKQKDWRRWARVGPAQTIGHTALA